MGNQLCSWRGLRSLRCVDVLRQGGLSGLAQCGESLEVVDGKLGEDLAVYLDLSQAQAVDEVMSFMRAAALMRWIHSLRNSDLRARRSR